MSFMSQSLPWSQFSKVHLFPPVTLKSYVQDNRAADNLGFCVYACDSERTKCEDPALGHQGPWEGAAEVCGQEVWAAGGILEAVEALVTDFSYTGSVMEGSRQQRLRVELSRRGKKESLAMCPHLIISSSFQQCSLHVDVPELSSSWGACC